MPATDVPLHPDVRVLATLLGTWEGDGKGDYPTIEPFRYRERVTFGHVGKPFLAYQQRTWDPDHGAPMHAETGYLRAVVGSDGQGSGTGVELVLAHPTGIVEIEEGDLRDGRLQLISTAIGLSSTAKRVHTLRREFRIEGDVLVYDLWMAHAGTPETHHLHAELSRTV